MIEGDVVTPGANQANCDIVIPVRSPALDGQVGISAMSSTICSVADIVKGAKDSRGELVTRVFFKRRSYAIYEANGKVLVQYSDDETVATAQIQNTASLIPMRERLHFLVAGRQHKTCYLPQVAEAFRLGLETNSDVGQKILQCAIDDIQETRAREGRIVYLTFAIPISLAAAIVLGGAGIASRDIEAMLVSLAAAGGVLGALLSIMIAIRTRSVAVDGDHRTNVLDGAARLLIGLISAGILFLILTAGVIPEVKIGEASLLGSEATWRTALIIGFAAGFLERLLPDLLAKGAKAGAPTILAPAA